MKILMTTDTVGGVWTYSLELARALAPYDVEVTLATLGAPLTPAQRADADELGNVATFESDFRLEWMKDPWDDVAQSQEWVHAIAQRVQPDLIHANTYCHAAMDWSVPVLLVGHSCVYSWHREVRGCEAGPKWSRYHSLVVQALRRADLVVAPTRAMLAMLERHYGLIPRKRAILNGLRPGARATQAKEPFVFTAGRLWDEAKNIAAVAQAARRINWPVRVAGLPHPDGGEGRVDGIEYLGRLSTREMAEQFARASIYALPARYEPFGLTPLEAALGGCALVLGDIPTLREVWGEAAAFVSPDDCQALADAVNRLIRDPALLRQRAEVACRRALELNSDRQAAAYFDGYQELLAGVRNRKLQEAH